MLRREEIRLRQNKRKNTMKTPQSKKTDQINGCSSNQSKHRLDKMNYNHHPQELNNILNKIRLREESRSRRVSTNHLIILWEK